MRGGGVLVLGKPWGNYEYRYSQYNNSSIHGAVSCWGVGVTPARGSSTIYLVLLTAVVVVGGVSSCDTAAVEYHRTFKMPAGRR